MVLRVVTAVIVLLVAGVVLLALSAMESFGECNPNENGVTCPPEQSGNLPLYIGALPVLVGCVSVAVGRPARWWIPIGIALAVLGVAVAAAVSA